MRENWSCESLWYGNMDKIIMILRVGILGEVRIRMACFE